MSDEAETGLSAARRLPWRDLYEAHASDLLGYLWRLTGDQEMATDMMQETFVMGMRDEAQLRDPEKVRPWLYRIATRLATRRRERARLIPFLPFTGRETKGEGGLDIEGIAVRDALRALPTDQAAVLVLHYEQGFTRAEIAEMTGRSEETIKSRIARGKRSFLAAYQRHGGIR